MDPRPPTVLVDLDGTVFKHQGTLDKMSKQCELLPRVLEKFAEWDRKGYNIIILTGRRESMRDMTKRQLEFHGLFYDQLIMGVGGGIRILINDKKDNGSITAFAICPDRNEGLINVEI